MHRRLGVRFDGLVANFESLSSCTTRFIYFPDSTLVDMQTCILHVSRLKARGWPFILFSAKIQFGWTCILSTCFPCKHRLVCFWEPIGMLRFCSTFEHSGASTTDFSSQHTLCKPPVALASIKAQIWETSALKQELCASSSTFLGKRSSKWSKNAIIAQKCLLSLCSQGQNAYVVGAVSLFYLQA